MPYKSNERRKQYNKEYRLRNKDRLAITAKKYWEDHRDELLEYHRNLNKTSNRKKQTKKYNRRRVLAYYGITDDEYDKMLDEQGGACAICGQPPKTRSLAVDHEHQTKDKKRTPQSRKVRVRGLLCYRCNRALGMFGNDIEKLMVASQNFCDYVEKYYAKRLIDTFGFDEAERRIFNTTKYLEKFERSISESLELCSDSPRQAESSQTKAPLQK